PGVRVAPDGEEVELLHLARGGLAELGAAVPRIHAEQRREPVEVAVALLVPHVRALAANDDRHLAPVKAPVPGEVHPQMPLGELLEILSRGGGGCTGRCHLVSSRHATACPASIDVPYKPYPSTRRDTTG